MPVDPRVNDNPSTYFVQDRKNKKELTRLKIQDQMITAGMGGVLPEQPDAPVFRRVLDVACGTGGWLIEAAKAYPDMSLTGIDISQRMIEYARTQAKEQHVDDRVAFCVMDALRPLEFPPASFDLVNMRLGVSFVRTWDWSKLLTEMLRITCQGGIVRIIEGEAIHQSNSPALTRLCGMSHCALYRSGHFFTQGCRGVTDDLPQLLDQYGWQQVKTKTYAIKHQAGTEEGNAFCENMALAFQTLRPFIQKWGCASPDYETIYQQALVEMRQPDFLATVNLLVAWGYK